MRKQIESARLQKAEGGKHNAERSLEQSDRRLIESLTARRQFEAARMQKSDGRRPKVDQ